MTFFCTLRRRTVIIRLTRLSMELDHNDTYDRSAVPPAAASIGGEDAMYNSTIGKAWKFVEQVMTRTKSWIRNGVTPVAIDDMVYMGENFIDKRDTFVSIPGSSSVCDVTVQLAYHYTDPDNLMRIRTSGLLSRPERQSKGIESHRFNGSCYGEGVYVALDPFRTRNYGSVGVMVAIAQGNCSPYQTLHHPYDSIRIESRQFVVLCSSHQCIPLLCFPREMVVEKAVLLHEYHVQMQHLLDEHFNENSPTLPDLAEWQKQVGHCHTRQWRRPLGSPPTFPSVKLPPRTSLRRISAEEYTCGYDGFMTVVLIPSLHCTGYERSRLGTISLACHLTQPSAIHWQAYYPDTKQAQDLVKRLQFAFRKGYMFCRSESSKPRTTTKIVAWTVVHCPTWICPAGDDDQQSRSHFESNMAKADRQLNSLGVPAADLLPAGG